MPKNKHPRKTRFQPYITGDLRRQIEAHCAKRGVRESAFTQEALSRYLDGTDDQTLLYRRLDANNRQIRRLSQQLDLQGQFFCEFVQLWLHNTPPLPQPDQAATRRQAVASYHRLLERTAASMSSGRTFIDELPKEFFSPIVEDSPVVDASRGAVEPLG